jgi:hypothetical protein
MCVGVSVWLGSGGIRVAGWNTASACILIPHHPSQTTTYHQHSSYQSNTTHEITQQISRKLLRMDVLTFEICWALNNGIIKQVTSSWSIFIQQRTEFMCPIGNCSHCSQMYCVFVNG